MNQLILDSKKVSKFLELNIVNDATRRQYAYHLRLFFQWKKIIDIDSYVKDPRLMKKQNKIKYEDSIKDDILEYWKYINDKQLGKTPYIFLPAMRRFLEANEIIFSPEFWRTMRKNGHGNYAITNYQTPTKQQLKNILSNADCEDKALFLMQMTSGQRINTVLRLTWKDIQLEHEYPRLFIRRPKGKRPVHTRITPEAKEYLLQYKEQYLKTLETREKRTPIHTRKTLDTNLVFPMTVQTVEAKWKTLTSKAGLYEKDNETNLPLYGTHSLRRYFQQYLGNENDALFFMGKTPENIATYKRMSQEQLDLVYIKGAENLVVFKEKSDLPKYLNEYDDKFSKVEDELETAKERNDIYKHRLKEQEDRLQKLEKILNKNILRFDISGQEPLSEDEQEIEDRIANKLLTERETRLKQSLATDPNYKNSKLIYIDDIPFITQKTPSKEQNQSNEMFETMEKIVLLDSLSKYDSNTQKEIIKLANKMKQERKDACQILTETNQNKHNLILREPQKNKRKKHP